jgi:uncharacterized membrane protein YccC
MLNYRSFYLSYKQFTRAFVYIAKCVTGVIIVFTLSYLFHYYDISWCLISVMLVLSPDGKDAMMLAMTRIKANVTGGIASFLCLIFGVPSMVTIGLAIGIAISLCYIFKIMAASRSALAAVIIIMLHQSGGPDYHLWSTALQRCAGVTAGCLLGLFITFIFHKDIRQKSLKPQVVDE